MSTTASSSRTTQSSSEKENGHHHAALKDEVNVPESMAAALDCDDPVQALHLISSHSNTLAVELSEKLLEEVQTYKLVLPDTLASTKQPDHPLHSAIACSESVRQSLNKIASGGSQASQEIRLLEQEKSELEEHARAVQMALTLRTSSDKAIQAMQTNQLREAAEAVKPWLEWHEAHNQSNGRNTESARCRAYAGEYCLKQLATTHGHLKETLLQQYEAAVLKSDLAALGELTPILSLVQLEPDAVRFYLQFLKSIIMEDFQKASQQKNKDQRPPPFVPMARVYNAAVSCLRHHLPMVSHFLYKADGDSSVVQLVHGEVEQVVLPLLEQYQKDRQLTAVYNRAQQIYAALEERYTGRAIMDHNKRTSDDPAIDDEEADDCNFSVAIGSLSDADAAMEEAARCIQSAESYLRFIRHSADQINEARRIRFEQSRRQNQLDGERTKWKNSNKQSDDGHVGGDSDADGKEYQPSIIVPDNTSLHTMITEIGGKYAGIEKCLLLASMQRAFVSSDLDPRYYRPLSLSLESSVAAPERARTKALQTSMVDACMYAARHGAQRAFATGHTSTASAMTNVVSDCLTGVLLEVLCQRAEEAGVALLKPGDGLLVGVAGLFNNASNLIRQGAHASGVRKSHDEEAVKRQNDIAHACATLNDIEVAVDQVQRLSKLLTDAVAQGFPPGIHETEQLSLCVQSLSTVVDSFRIASNATVESLESVLKPRLRSIVGESVGSEGGTFMGSSVAAMGGAKASDRGAMARMNYNLDEETYNLLQLSEGYVARLCHSLDELMDPLRQYLAPRLWDTLILSAVGTVSKRLETSIRKCEFTALGALTLDADVRDIVNYVKERLYAPEYNSTAAVTKACPALSRLLQIAKLLSVDDLDDVVDLISSAKRKGNWDLKLDDAKSLLSSRVEFESSKVNTLLRLPDNE
jgi:hypothetical protein